MHAYRSWCSISQAHSGCMQVLALLVPCSDQHGAVRADHTGWALACLLVRTASSIHMQNLSLHHVCDWHVLAVFTAVACKVSGEGGGGAGGCLCVVLDPSDVAPLCCIVSKQVLPVCGLVTAGLYVAYQLQSVCRILNILNAAHRTAAGK